MEEIESKKCRFSSPRAWKEEGRGLECTEGVHQEGVWEGAGIYNRPYTRR